VEKFQVFCIKVEENFWRAYVARVAELELNYQTPGSDFPKFPTPTPDSDLSKFLDSRLRLLHIKGMKFGFC